MTDSLSTLVQAARETGKLIQPDHATMAREARRRIGTGTWFVPMVTWEKQFAGQTTGGRIGCPVIHYCPISWLPENDRNAVEALLLQEDGS